MEQMSNVEELCRAYGLTGDGRAAVQKAYDVFRAHHGPFIASIAAQMLPDLRRDAEAGSQVVFVGRDGHSFAAATKALDPDFYADHCREVVLSRVVVEAAVQDLERDDETRFSQISGLRSVRDRIDPESVPGSYRRLTGYLRSRGVPVDRDNSKVTLCDSSFKGTIQTLLAAAYPHTEFQGRYAFFGAVPGDPEAGRKTGYAVHIPNPDLLPEGQRPPFWGVPDDRQLTFAGIGATRVIEDTLNGPLESPRRIDPAGVPDQMPLSQATNPLEGLNPVVVGSEFRDPTVREAVKGAALLAVYDAALQYDRSASETGDYQAQRVDFTNQTVAWLTDPSKADPQFRQVMDSFVGREDRKTIEQIRSHFADSGVTPERAEPVWQEFDRLGSLDEKRVFASGVVKSANEAPSVLRASFPVSATAIRLPSGSPAQERARDTGAWTPGISAGGPAR